MIESFVDAPILRFGRGASSKLAVEVVGLSTLTALFRGAGAASGATHPVMKLSTQRQTRRLIDGAHQIGMPRRIRRSFRPSKSTT